MGQIQPADVEVRARLLYDMVAEGEEASARADPARHFLMIDGAPVVNAVTYHRWDALPGDVANAWRGAALIELEAELEAQ